MKIFSSLDEFIDSKLHIDAFVPTMGNLHNGHLQLVEVAKKNAKNTCVSIYVNESQFTDKKDFDSYPKTLDADIKRLKDTGVDYILIPEKRDIENNSEGFDPVLEPKILTNDLCGKYRKGHFLAVMDIVHRFFQIIKPNIVVLGEKDYQQIVVIKELIKICNHKIRILSCPIIRDDSGLALSSRNNLLSEAHKEIASEIYKSLVLVSRLYEQDSSPRTIEEEINIFFSKSLIELEYFTIRDLKTLQQPNDNDLIALIAGYLGTVRLIDNIIIKSHLK